MAALTATYVTGKLPVGHKALRTIRFTVANADAADEWVDTGLSWIDDVVGCVPVNGTAVVTDVPIFKRNCGSGTGGTEDTAADGGLLSVEAKAATYVVTVIGKA